MVGERAKRIVAGAVIGVLVLAGAAATPGAATRGGPPGEAGTEGSGAGWRQVSAGGDHTCGIRTNGRLYCWGSDNQQQLGNGPGVNSQSSPGEVNGGGTNWVTVSAGGAHTCARRSTGRLFCWGRDVEGQLGDDNVFSAREVPTEVAGASTSWASFDTGVFHTCARRTTGRLFCWGRDLEGQLGEGEGTDTQTTPVAVGTATNWAQVATGTTHTCARRTNGRLFCWGRDEAGQLGEGPGVDDQQSPVQVAGSVTTWASVTAGGQHTCATRTNGRLFCWGQDANGELGEGAGTGPQQSPVQVAGRRTDWVNVDAGDSHTCGRRGNGRLYCWGWDLLGQLGDSVALASRQAPVRVAGSATNWRLPSAGSLHSCARRADGRVLCWGNGADGQLGDGDPAGDHPTPVRVNAP